MLDMTFLQFIGSLGGIGAVFAILLFWVYRQSVKQNHDDRKFMEDRLTKVIDDYNTTCRDSQHIMSEHTKVLTELITWLRARNGNH